MATRASFWIGDPRDLENRKWLGCVCFDAYPDGLPELEKVKSLDDFKKVVKKYSKRDDYSSPKRGWPFPWDGNIFLTDFTYAWFDNAVQVACFHTGFYPFKEVVKKGFKWSRKDNLANNVIAPSKYNSGQPDSVMTISF